MKSPRGPLRHRAPLAAIACIAMAAVACSGSSERESLRSQLADIQMQVLQLQKEGPSKSEVEAIGTAVAERAEALLTSQADTEVALQALIAQIGQLETRFDDTNFRLTQLSQQIAATNLELQALRTAAEVRASRQPVQPPPIANPTDPQALYDSAYGDFQQGNYDLAVLGFHQYLDAFPETELADNASYWIGECYYRQQRYQKAVAQFDEVITRYGSSDRLASALLKKGYAYLALNQRAQGVVQLQHVIREYPGTDEAQLARQRLLDLGIDAGR